MTTQSQDELEARREALKRWVPERPYKPLTQGINHTAVFALDLEETARFYTEILGMPVLGIAPNRDEPGSTHMTIDIGNGSAISFFDFPHVDRLTKVAPEGGGNAMHIATPITVQSPGTGDLLCLFPRIEVHQPWEKTQYEQQAEQTNNIGHGIANTDLADDPALLLGAQMRHLLRNGILCADQCGSRCQSTC
jgi:catechol 2,3-dioxygenase-like lactoylglutathione lyase family enzyme